MVRSGQPTMFRSIFSSLRRLRGALMPALALTGAGALAAACDPGPRLPDASTVPSAHSAEVAVRFDVTPAKTNGGAVLGSILAFQAEVAGVDRSQVLGLVDPLSTTPPERDCELRDADVTVQGLQAKGGSVELRDMSGIGVGLGPVDVVLRPFPRLYPDVAGVVAGVVSETGPHELLALPANVSMVTGESDLPIAELAVPAPPRLLALNGAAPSVGLLKVDTSEGGLSVTFSGGAGTTVEVRPFGATTAILCAAPATPTGADETTIVIPSALLRRLPLGGAPRDSSANSVVLPASVDVLRRGAVRLMPTPASTRFSVEVRASATVELRL